MRVPEPTTVEKTQSGCLSLISATTRAKSFSSASSLTYRSASFAPPGPLEYEVAHDAVRLVRIDVGAADQINARTEVARHVLGQLGTVLVRRRTGVDHVARELEAFVDRRVHEQPVPSLDDRDHCLALARHVAAEDDIDLVVAHESRGQGLVILRHRLRVVMHRQQFASVDAARVIDLADREMRARQLRSLDARRDHRRAKTARQP